MRFAQRSHDTAMSTHGQASLLQLGGATRTTWDNTPVRSGTSNPAIACARPKANALLRLPLRLHVQASSMAIDPRATSGCRVWPDGPVKRQGRSCSKLHDRSELRNVTFNMSGPVHNALLQHSSGHNLQHKCTTAVTTRQSHLCLCRSQAKCSRVRSSTSATKNQM